MRKVFFAALLAALLVCQPAFAQLPPTPRGCLLQQEEASGHYTKKAEYDCDYFEEVDEVRS